MKPVKTIEKHYYREARRKISKILDLTEQKVIDRHMENHRDLPPFNTTREVGFSTFVLESKSDTATTLTVNPSMLKVYKPRGNSSSIIIERLKDAPALPISCVAAAEHVLSLRNKVTDFVSEFEPASKERVMYQILVKMRAVGGGFNRDSSALLAAILGADDQLERQDLTISFDRLKKLFVIDIGTQKGDIQKIVKAIKSIKYAKIINCEFSDIGLYQGVCLVKGDASNPIHALVNIADSDSQKGLMERDAGLTSGNSSYSYKLDSAVFNA